MRRISLIVLSALAVAACTKTPAPAAVPGVPAPTVVGATENAPRPWVVLPPDAVARITFEPEEVHVTSTPTEILHERLFTGSELELRDGSGGTVPVKFGIRISSNSVIKNSREDDIRAQAQDHASDPDGRQNAAVRIDGSWFERLYFDPDETPEGLSYFESMLFHHHEVSEGVNALAYRGDRSSISWVLTAIYDPRAIATERVQAVLEAAQLDDAAAADVLAKLDAIATRSVSAEGFRSNLGTVPLATTGFFIAEMRATGAPWSGHYEFEFWREKERAVLALACFPIDDAKASDRDAVEQALLQRAGVDTLGLPETQGNGLHHYRFERRMLPQTYPEEAWIAQRGQWLLVAREQGLGPEDRAKLEQHLADPDTHCEPVGLPH